MAIFSLIIDKSQGCVIIDHCFVREAMCSFNLGRLVMNDVRKGELAVLMLKYLLRRKGIHLGQNFKDDIREVAVKIGVSYDEAIEFAEIIVRDVVNEAFQKGKK